MTDERLSPLGRRSDRLGEIRLDLAGDDASRSRWNSIAGGPSAAFMVWGLAKRSLPWTSRL
jgi:hypothetical protein